VCQAISVSRSTQKDLSTCLVLPLTANMLTGAESIAAESACTRSLECVLSV